MALNITNTSHAITPPPTADKGALAQTLLVGGICVKMRPNAPNAVTNEAEHGRTKERNARHAAVVESGLRMTTGSDVGMAAHIAWPPKKWPRAALMIVKSSPTARQIA